jgi:hypothetical protein
VKKGASYQIVNDLFINNKRLKNKSYNNKKKQKNVREGGKNKKKFFNENSKNHTRDLVPVYLLQINFAA